MGYILTGVDIARPVKKFIVQITPQGKRKGLVMVKKLEKLQLEADPGSIDYSDERYMTVQNLFKIENKINNLIDLVNSQQEAIEKLQAEKIGYDDPLPADDKPEYPWTDKSKARVARYEQKIAEADTHRTVTLRIPKGMSIVEAIEEAYQDTIIHTDTDLQKALDEVQPNE